MDSDDEAHTEGTLEQIEEQARTREMALALERSDILKATRLLKRFANAWIWNRKDDLQSCLRACKGTRETKEVLVSFGIFSFIVYKGEAIAPLVGIEYAKELDTYGERLPELKKSRWWLVSHWEANS